jgi:hypothetical protein
VTRAELWTLERYHDPALGADHNRPRGRRHSEAIMADQAPYIAPGTVRAGTGSNMPSTSWRRGPDTTDGHWMVTTGRKDATGRPGSWAVRVIIDPVAETMNGYEVYTRLENALHAREHEAEDAYLAAVNVVRALPPDELSRLRDAVRAGKTGGAADGAPVRRSRARSKAGAA